MSILLDETMSIVQRRNLAPEMNACHSFPWEQEPTCQGLVLVSLVNFCLCEM